MSRKQIPLEALVNLRQRLELFPERSRERRKLIEEAASTYGVSVDTLYRYLRSSSRPKAAHRSDRGGGHRASCLAKKWNVTKEAHETLYHFQ